MDIVLLIAEIVIELALLVVVGTIAKNRFGINFGRIECPKCGEPAHRVRVPANLRQTLWGGCTCSNCGCEHDKWGDQVEP